MVGRRPGIWPVDGSRTSSFELCSRKKKKKKGQAEREREGKISRGRLGIRTRTGDAMDG